MSDNSVNRAGPDRSPVDARELLERWIGSRGPATPGVGNSLGERVRWTTSRARTGIANRGRTR